ncbi:hypothetical protein J1614_007310 [Plenodomus biglobosus]|nr:hypothetical protein J1614_007310 [Plenodomus biglobosus]
MTTDRRAPALGNATKGRLPPRASRQSNGLGHSHIRVIPHRSDADDIEDEYDDGVPTFRSPSLQFAASFTSQARMHEHPTAESVSQVTTFADMARRYPQADDDFKREQSFPSPGSVGGILKLQPHRKAGQPMRTSDLSHCENARNNPSETSSDRHPSAYPAREAIYPHVNTAMSTQPTLQSQIQSMLDNSTAASRAPAVPSGATGHENHRSSSYAIPGHNCERLFGRLPDPIRLREQTGDFDGQVVFIGHPNRDVSAHQWSSKLFQWVNIGRYAHVRGKVEGSLASDRLRDYDALQHPVEFFKRAAENRERHVAEKARQDTTTHSRTSVPAYTSESAKIFPVGGCPSTPESAQNTITREHLEDPFVAHDRSLMPGQTPLYRPKVRKANINGSLDFKYEFPSKASTSASDYRGNILSGRVPQSNLHELSFGEDATSNTGTTAGRFSIQQQASNYASLQNVKEKRVLEANLAKHKSPVSYARTPTGGHTGTSNKLNSYATARSLFPASGLTVANPRPAVLDADKPDSSHAKKRNNVPESEGPDSRTTTINPTTVALAFSDPDGLRQTQEYEIANGLSKQAPTVQNLKGPFFTDTKPTTIDPTAQLSVHVGEEEKLSSWFHDGHRPARQQAYARSLMSAAASYGRGRDFGAIGGISNSHPFAEYKNTPAYVRLYENLSEYTDERRNGTGSSYFTRAWKKNPQDLSTKSGNSYLDKAAPGSARLEWTGGYQAARHAKRGRGGA